MASASASRLTFPLGEQDRVLQLKIAIKDLHHPVWRRVLVPDNISLGQLHLVIQGCFQWRSYHLYVFRKGNRKFSCDPVTGSPFNLFTSKKDENANDVKISEVLPAPRTRLEYEYAFDGGDGWKHSILLEKVVPHVEGQVYPLCIEGQFKGPPDVCESPSVSPSGYQEICEALWKPSNLRHERQKQWIDWLHDFYPDYNNPEDFTPAQVTFEDVVIE